MAIVNKAKTPVIDAKTSMIIHITKADVRAGTLKDAASCAAAKAICRQSAVEKACVYLSRIYVKKGGKWIRFATPISLRNEIIAFDRGGAFEPGDYTLSPVQPVVQFKNKRNRAAYMAEYNARPHRAKKEVARKRKRGRVHVVKNVRASAGRTPPLD